MFDPFKDFEEERDLKNLGRSQNRHLLQSKPISDRTHPLNGDGYIAARAQHTCQIMEV